MALLTGGSIVNGEITGLDASSTTTGGYFDQRTNPADESETQVREHETQEKVFEGLTQAAAEALAGVFQTTSKTVTRTSSHMGGGMYQVVQQRDIITDGTWNTL